jgi:hypothetical protein
MPPVQLWDHVTYPLDVDKKMNKKYRVQDTLYAPIPETSNEQDSVGYSKADIMSQAKLQNIGSVTKISVDHSQIEMANKVAGGSYNNQYFKSNTEHMIEHNTQSYPVSGQA